jgi:EAL domain-containing protein (putative c-di-GMP-specific phosphodiesterase class I)
MLIDEWEHTVGALGELRRLGFRVGLDDFGIGYTSLGYLRRLPSIP